MKKENTSVRLKEIMKERNLRQVDILEKCKPFCERFNVKLARNDLSQYVNGKVEPGQEKLTILALALSVNEAWLMGYDVPMERGEKTNTSKDSAQIMEYFNKLNSNGKEIATEQVRLLTLDEKYTMPDKIIPLKKDTTEPVGNAAHVRTDLPESELTPDLQREDEEIWKNF